MESRGGIFVGMGVATLIVWQFGMLPIWLCILCIMSIVLGVALILYDERKKLLGVPCLEDEMRLGEYKLFSSFTCAGSLYIIAAYKGEAVPRVYELRRRKLPPENFTVIVRDGKKVLS